jgi:hypothetical protein
MIFIIMDIFIVSNFKKDNKIIIDLKFRIIMFIVSSFLQIMCFLLKTNFMIRILMMFFTMIIYCLYLIWIKKYEFSLVFYRVSLNFLMTIICFVFQLLVI